MIYTWMGLANSQDQEGNWHSVRGIPYVKHTYLHRIYILYCDTGDHFAWPLLLLQFDISMWSSKSHQFKYETIINHYYQATSSGSSQLGSNYDNGTHSS